MWASNHFQALPPFIFKVNIFPFILREESPHRLLILLDDLFHILGKVPHLSFQGGHSQPLLIWVTLYDGVILAVGESGASLGVNGSGL